MLICWLTDCPAAVRKFLEIDGVVNFLLTLVNAAPGIIFQAGILSSCPLVPLPTFASQSSRAFVISIGIFRSMMKITGRCPSQTALPCCFSAPA